jgi:hypothetical protein
MSATLLDAIKQQASGLSTKEKFTLAHYLLEQARQEKPQNESTDNGNTNEEVRQRRMAWLKANREQYGGQYVVLDGDRLLGVAKNYPEGRRIALDAGVPDAFINYLSKPDEIGYMGGW